jgi:hypothetical protein
LLTLGSGLLLSACSFGGLGGAPPAPTPNAQQQAAMQDPEQVVRLMYDLEQQERYDEIEPLLTPERRSTIIGERGSVAANYVAANRNLGKLRSYTIQDTRESGDTAEVDIETVYPATSFQSTVGLVKGPLGWQVRSVRNR